MKSKFCLLLTLLSFLAFTAVDGAIAGTGKSLSWCSYLNRSGKYINRMRCIQTLGLSNTYCFNHIHWKNGVKAELDCETWLWDDPPVTIRLGLSASSVGGTAIRQKLLPPTKIK
jgi:hypothetical protein